MSEKLLLVDFENVQQIDLSRLDDGYQILIFVGASQKNIPIELVKAAQKRGDKLEWRNVDANGSNALDFFIACQLGRVFEKAPKTHCVILSKDKGFDPLLRHLNKIGLQSKRVNSLMELHPDSSSPVEDANYKRVVELLGKSEKKARPRKRKTLSQSISSFFQKKIAQTEVDRIVDVLFANKMIFEANGAITYEF